jgi:hypothetical protein
MGLDDFQCITTAERIATQLADHSNGGAMSGESAWQEGCWQGGAIRNYTSADTTDLHRDIIAQIDEKCKRH